MAGKSVGRSLKEQATLLPQSKTKQNKPKTKEPWVCAATQLKERITKMFSVLNADHTDDILGLTNRMTTNILY